MAPVSVAKSIRPRGARDRGGVRERVCQDQPPSASVLMTSIVLPFIARTMSPGRIAVPLGMFSVAGTTRDDLDRHCQLGDQSDRLDDRGPAGHVELHLLHAAGGLDGDAPRVDVTALPTRPRTSPAARLRVGV